MTPLTLLGRPIWYSHGQYYCYCYSKSDAVPDLLARPTNGLSSAFLIRLPYTRDYYSNHATSAGRVQLRRLPAVLTSSAPSASASAIPTAFSFGRSTA